VKSIKRLLKKKGFFIKIISEYYPYLILLFFVFSFLFVNEVSFDQDLGRHLKLGEIIWNTHQIPAINLFSYTNPNSPFVNHHWLFEVIAYLSSISIGLEALLIFKIIILLIAVLIILVLAKRTKSALLIPVSFIFLHLMRERIDLRPEIFSFLFTALTFYILDKFEKNDSKLIYLLPLISLIWVNTHIYFPVGIFLQLIFLVSLLIRKFMQKKDRPIIANKLKILAIVTGLSIAVSLLNPNLLKGALYPFTVFSNYGVTITENQTIFILQNNGFKDQNFLFYFMSGFIVLVSIYISLWKKPNFKNILLSLLGLALATQSIRGFPYLVLISLPAVLQNFNYNKFGILTKILNLVVVILIIGEAVFYLSGNYYKLTYQPYTPSLNLVEDAKPALDFLLKNNLPQPIFNNFDIGSYIIYRTYPKYKVFIDGRPEAYPASFFANTYVPMQEDYAKFKQEEKIYGFKTVIFSIPDQNPRTIKFLNLITKDSDWQTVFLDQFMIILIRSEAQTKLKLNTVDLVTLNANGYHYSNCVNYTNLSTFLFNIHYLKPAESFNKKALNLCPDNPAANYIMTNILLNEGTNINRFPQYNAKSTDGVFW
jgi:hypothetical protein